MVSESNLITLTARQRECMALVRDGLSSKQIARKLSISHRTVEHHVAASIEALGVANRMAAITRLHELELDEERKVREAAPEMRTLATTLENDLANTSSRQIAAPTAWPLLPPAGGKLNQAPRSVRTSWIIRIAILALMFSCAVIIFVLGFSTMVGVRE